MGGEDQADIMIGVIAAARFLGMTAASVQHLVDRGRLPHFRIGRRICFRRATLNAWLAECEAKAAEERAHARLDDDGGRHGKAG